jgi:hypothetical protein
VVKPLNLVMSHRTFILEWAALSFSFFTQVGLALSILSSLIFDGMIKSAVLVVMLILEVAEVNLEFVKVQVLDNLSPVGSLVLLHYFENAIRLLGLGAASVCVLIPLRLV